MRFSQPSVLLTDLYQLTMLQAYHRHRMLDVAVFEFFVRKLPAGRNFFIAAGLEQVLDYLESLHFEPDELEWLAQTGRFQPEFVRYLSQLRFTGDVHAMPEGTVFFPHEPILRVTAPTANAPIDGFGIGTRVDVSADAPYLDCAYKLQGYAGQPRRKTSEGKATWPGRKQVFREFGPDGRIVRDHVSLESSTEPGQPLLVSVMHNGKRAHSSESLAAIRQRSANQLTALPESLRALDTAECQYATRLSLARR